MTNQSNSFKDAESSQVINRATRMLVLATLFLFGTSIASAQMEATIEKVWVEYGVKAKGQPHILIHTKFAVKKALKVGGSIQVTVRRDDGDIMLTKSIGTVYAVDEKVLILSTFTSPYDSATYADTKLWLPYWALGLHQANPNKMKLTVKITGQNKVLATSSMSLGLALD